MTENANAFALQLIQGEAPDLMEVRELYVGNLAEQGILCDLSAYYADVPNVGEKYILEPVWEGMQSKGKNVLVIPSFHILAQACEVPIAAQEWTPERLIQLVEEEEELWEDGTSYTRLFRECTGRDQEYRRYVDYEEKEVILTVKNSGGYWKIAQGWEMRKRGRRFSIMIPPNNRLSYIIIPSVT